MSQFTYFTLNPPQKWRAGFTREGPNQKPFYFDCADCDAHEPEIAGIIGTGPTIEQVAILSNSQPPYKLAMFCAPCLAKRLAA